MDKIYCANWKKVGRNAAIYAVPVAVSVVAGTAGAMGLYNIGATLGAHTGAAQYANTAFYCGVLGAALGIAAPFHAYQLAMKMRKIINLR